MCAQKKILKTALSILTITALVFSLSGCFLVRRIREARPRGESLEVETADLGSSIKAEDIEIFISPDMGGTPDISIRKLTEKLPSEPEDSQGVGDAYEIESRDRLKEPVLITLKYDPGDLPEGTSEENMYIATRRGSRWVVVEDGYVDIQENTVNAAVDHFSDFWAMVKKTGDAIYDVVETAAIDTTTTGISYSKLPVEIKNDLSSVYLGQEDISAITRYKFSLIVKVGHSLNSYFNGLTKLLGLAIAAIDGTKTAIAEALAEAAAYEVFEYTGNEKGTYSLIIYDTIDFTKDIGLLTLDASAGVPMVALKGTNYLAARVMDDINEDMHDAFRNLISLNPNSTNRLEIYSICIDARPDRDRPGVKGIIFYYYDESKAKWIKYYEDLLYWVVEFEPDEKDQPGTDSQDTNGEGGYYQEEDEEDDRYYNDEDEEDTYQDSPSDTDQSGKDTKEEEVDKETGEEETQDTAGDEEEISQKTPQGPVTVYLTPGGGGDYPGLEEAVRDVASGSTIFLDSGTYYLSDDILINKEIEILGTRMDLVEIIGDDGIFDFEGSYYFTVEDITFTAKGDTIIDAWLGSGDISIKNCRFSGGYIGVSITADTTGVIQDCEFYDNSTAIDISGDEADIRVEGNIITGNGNGISMHAHGAIIDNECSWNRYSGISANDSGNILIENNTVSYNGSDGIYLGSDFRGTVSYNDCFGNETGIWVGTDASPTLEYNTCYDNKNYGIIFTDATSGTARQNECYSNNIGLAVYLDAWPQLTDNYCHDNYEKDIDD